jgi:NitT/TauT family transport system substrate-binding protein
MKALVALVALLLALTTAAATTQTLPALRVAYQPFEGAAQVLYAKDEGFFAKEGVNVELQPISFGSAIASAVASNAIDVGFATVVTLAIAHSKQIPFVLVAPAVFAVAPNAPPSGGLMVANTSQIHSAKDLDGKVLCTPGLGTLAEFAPRAWIDANGGDSSTLKVIEVPFTAMDAAIASGRCDAGYVTEPYYTPAKRDARTLAWTLDAVSKDYLAAGWFTTTDWAREHRDAVRRFAAAMRDAAEWANRKPPAVADILVKELKADPATVSSEVRDVFGERLTPALLQPNIDVAARYLKFAPFPAGELIYAASTSPGN